MELTRNTTSIAKQTTGDSATFVTGNSTDPNSVVKWDSNGNAIASGFEMTNDNFGGALPSSTIKVPTQAAINTLINSRLGTADGSQLGEVKISTVNDPASGEGGLSISDKINGVQTITYTPPNVLTANQIDNTGYDAGEFAAFNADGNLITSNMKKSLVIDSTSTDNTFPTTKRVFDYGQDIGANRLLGVDDTINHGDFLSYNSSTGGFEANAASISNHKLFSATHTDVKSNVTPSYGDSMYYDGNEWTVGNFGNWGADMEYRPISGASGTTFTNLTWGRFAVSAITTHAGSHYDRYFSLPAGQRFVNLKQQTTPQSGVFTPAIHDMGSVNYSNDFYNPNFRKTSRIGFGSWWNNYGENEGTHDVQCSIQFPLAGLSGTGLVNSKIRGLYIRVHNWMHAGNSERKTSLYISYPDGSKKPLSEFQRKMEESSTVSSDLNQVLLVPINEGQSQIEIDCDLNRHTSEGIEFEIIGALCTKRIELSPEIDIIQIVGSQLSTQSAQGYVDENTSSFQGDPSVWTSEAPTTTGATDWSGVFPIEIPDNVSKSVISIVNNWNYGASANEEIDHITITVDWNANTIFGTYTWGSEYEETGFLYSTDLVGEKEFTVEQRTGDANTPTTIKFELNGRSIVKLPCPAHGTAFANTGQKYTIENYKTIASTTRKLETGFTTVGTTGTADTDGYLIVTGQFDPSDNIDGFKVTIGTEVFLNRNYGWNGNNGRETMTLPIAAGESWSVAVGDDATAAAQISFDVRFKAKSTEISDSNSFNLIDSGATGTFEISSPHTYEELDLSPIVGTNKTLVVLEVFGGTSSPVSNLYFKTNGSSILPYQAENVTGNGSAAIVISPAGAGGTVTVMTDVNGKVAYMGEATGTVYYKVQGYQGVVSAPNGAIAYTGGESTTLPNGLIMKTGLALEADRVMDSSHSISITFETPFPNGIISIQATGLDNTTSTAPAAQSNVHIKPGYDVNGFRMYTNTSGNNLGNFWTVIGY